MSLVYDTRVSTQDIDALFEPDRAIAEIVREMAEEYEQLDYDWINDGVRGFMSHTTVQVPFADYGSLTVLTVSPEYLLSMKLMAGRPYGPDKDDIRTLLAVLGYGTAEEALSRLEEHFPTQRHHIKAKYILLEVLGK
ncbi:MAG: hypothetical protein Q7U75_06900, partial [Desulfobacterales bacterium]|nr:hypothetical protein [Desulfobacterales bacterium]